MTRAPQNGEGIPVDDLVPLLNPVQQADLAVILEMTPRLRRPFVALAFAGIDEQRWRIEAGIGEQSVYRWLRNYARIPFGGAVRLARVIGADPVVLFAAQLD